MNYIDPKRQSLKQNSNSNSISSFAVYDGGQHDLGSSGNNHSRGDQHNYNSNFSIFTPDLASGHGGGPLTLADIHSVDGRDLSRSMTFEASEEDGSRGNKSSKRNLRTPQHSAYRPEGNASIYTEGERDHRRSNSNNTEDNFTAAPTNTLATNSNSYRYSNNASEGNARTSSISAVTVVREESSFPRRVAVAEKRDATGRPYHPEMTAHSARPSNSNNNLSLKPSSGNNSVSSSNTTAPSDSSFVTLTRREQKHPNRTETPQNDFSRRDNSQKQSSQDRADGIDRGSGDGIIGGSSGSGGSGRAPQPSIYRPSKADFERARRLLAK